VEGSGTNRAESDAHIIASLRAELSDLTVRGFELELRILELETGRWRAFSLVELEWITNAFAGGPDLSEWDDVSLPAEANGELERRARLATGLDEDPAQGMR
jgi:hypothetical protein